MTTDTDRINGSAEALILFGPFRVLPKQRLLMQANKPVHLGSSIGVGKADSIDEVRALLPTIFRLDPQAIVEPFVPNLVEYNLAVTRIGGTVRSSGIEQPKRAEELLDFRQKYLSGGDGKSGTKGEGAASQGMLSLTRDINPTLPQGLENSLRRWAADAFEARQRLTAKTSFAEILYAARDPFSRKIVIDQGSQHAVRAGEPVIDGRGVIGQVTRVYPWLAEVTLITDKGHLVPVLNPRNGLRAVLAGTGNDGALELKFVPLNADFENNDQLVTSGISDSTTIVAPASPAPIACISCAPSMPETEATGTCSPQKRFSSLPFPASMDIRYGHGRGCTTTTATAPRRAAIAAKVPIQKRAYPRPVSWTRAILPSTSRPS